MKVAINKQRENQYEVGYYIGNKLNYHIMESKEAVQYIKKMKPKKVVSNNVILKINNEEVFKLDSLTLRMMNIAEKIKIKSFLFVKINSEVTFYYYDGKKIEVLQRKDFQKKSKLSVRTNCGNYNLYEKYAIYTSLYDSLLIDESIDLEKIYDGYLKNDYVCKVIIKQLKDVIEQDILLCREKYTFSNVVIRTNFNQKISKDLVNLKCGIVVNLEKINKRDNLRMILNVKNKG